MAYKSLLFVCYALWLSMFSSHHTMADDLDGLINIDEDDSGPQKESTVINERVESADGEEDGEDDYSGSVMSDESGSGSGDGGDETTTDPSIVDVTVVSPSVTSTTEMDNEITESTSKSTVEPENVFGGGVNTVSNNFATEDSTEESPNAEAQGQGRKGGKDMVGEKVPKVLTTEVIAAVVVGAVCAVILIAFLVYRLRKRDEGSYALSDGGYKDTYKLQADTGKEAFV
ncbi:unnamed protein product [Porites evermanni]|uniref:Syndecan/Neurexin domain-containing protein n=1 Tax=Porites evermanni TaxID=104178 RepID=A0ABN8MI43_9CNID|nr:unnamed protein product [Porites evermanni]